LVPAGIESRGDTVEKVYGILKGGELLMKVKKGLSHFIFSQALLESFLLLLIILCFSAFFPGRAIPYI